MEVFSRSQILEKNSPGNLSLNSYEFFYMLQRLLIQYFFYMLKRLFILHFTPLSFGEGHGGEAEHSSVDKTDNFPPTRIVSFGRRPVLL